MVDHRNDGGIEILRFHKIAQILYACLFQIGLQFFVITVPCLLEGHSIFFQFLVGIQFDLLGKVFIKDEPEGEIHKVAGRHVATQGVGNRPKLAAQFLLEFFAHIWIYYLFPIKHIDNNAEFPQYPFENIAPLL